MSREDDRIHVHFVADSSMPDAEIIRLLETGLGRSLTESELIRLKLDQPTPRETTT